MNFFQDDIPSPCFVIEEAKLIRNLELMKEIQEETGASILLALKGFSVWSLFPLIKNYLDGAAASSLNEARLVYEQMHSKAHAYSLAYSTEEFEKYLPFCSHIIFNSLQQFESFSPIIQNKWLSISSGIRINPGVSNIGSKRFNPADSESRLGVPISNLPSLVPQGVKGLHIHVLGEGTSYDLEQVLIVLEKKLESYLQKIDWLNLGGGHFFTAPNYDLTHFNSLIRRFLEKYPLRLFFEPSHAVAWNIGFLKAEVLDIHEGKSSKTAILNFSWKNNLPDSEGYRFPYKLNGVVDKQNEGYEYFLGGLSCLSEDRVGPFKLKNQLKVGDSLIIENALAYSIVKNNYFNGIKPPSIGLIKLDGSFELLNEYSYEDYKKFMGGQ